MLMLKMCKIETCYEYGNEICCIVCLYICLWLSNDGCLHICRWLILGMIIAGVLEYCGDCATVPLCHPGRPLPFSRHFSLLPFSRQNP